MRSVVMFLLSLMLFTVLAGCAGNAPVTLFDDMGEVDTPEVVTLDQIEFDCEANFEAALERCEFMHDPEMGIYCNTETAQVYFDADGWGPNIEWAEYNIDQFSEMPDGELVWIWNARKPKWAECGCPSGCSAAECNWERNEDNSYSCTGDCRGTHCSTCVVELRELEDVGPTG